MEDVSSARPARPAELPDLPDVPGGFPLPLLLVMRLAGVYRKVFTEELAREEWAGPDAAPPMYPVLRAAAYLDGPSQRDIATAIGLDPSDLVSVIDRMERNGWITRERDANDRRRYVVRITDGGRRSLDRYNAVARRAGDRLMAELDDTEREQFSGLALRMLHSAGEVVGRPRPASAPS